MKILTLYTAHDFGEFSLAAAMYKIFEAGFNCENAELVLSNECEYSGNIASPMKVTTLNLNMDCWMILDRNKKFMFFCYGA
jgi:hypothetical protein